MVVAELLPLLAPCGCGSGLIAGKLADGVGSAAALLTDFVLPLLLAGIGLELDCESKVLGGTIGEFVVVCFIGHTGLLLLVGVVLVVLVVHEVLVFDTVIGTVDDKFCEVAAVKFGEFVFFALCGSDAAWWTGGLTGILLAVAAVSFSCFMAVVQCGELCGGVEEYWPLGDGCCEGEEENLLLGCLLLLVVELFDVVVV